MLESLIVTMYAAPLVFGIYGWYEYKRQKARKLKLIQKRLEILEKEKSSLIDEA